MVGHQEQRSRAYLLVSFKFFNVYVFCAEIVLVQLYTLDKHLHIFVQTHIYTERYSCRIIYSSNILDTISISVSRMLVK